MLVLSGCASDVKLSAAVQPVRVPTENLRPPRITKLSLMFQSNRKKQEGESEFNDIRTSVSAIFMDNPSGEEAVSSSCF